MNGLNRIFSSKFAGIAIAIIIGFIFAWIFFSAPSGDHSQTANTIDSASSESTTWTCSMHPQIKQADPGKCPICGMDLILLIPSNVIGAHSGNHSQMANTVDSASSESTIWTCSMHPQIKQPDPGKCPICGMNLIPLTSSDDARAAHQMKMPESATVHTTEKK